MLKEWATYYWMNFLDENYKAKVPWKLQQIIIFKKGKRVARIEVYDNCICFDIRELWKDEIYHNVDWNDKEIIEWVKLTKRKNINILWAASFVLDLWYKYIEDKIYGEEQEQKEISVYNAVQFSLF